MICALPPTSYLFWLSSVKCFLLLKCSLIQAHQGRRRLRAALTLYHVIKGLASKRLASDRAHFKQLTLAIFQPLNAISDQLLEQMQTDIARFALFQKEIHVRCCS